MEVATVKPVEASTNSKTMADLLPHRRTHAQRCSGARHKVDGEWIEISYAELGDGRPRDLPRPDRPGHRAG